MGKILIAVLICCAFMAQGCEAFKDYYDTPPAEVIGNVVGGTPDESTPPNSGGTDVEIDMGYNADDTSCECEEDISVAVVEEDEQVNGGWTLEVEEDAAYSVTALQIGPYTTTISIDKEYESLSFTIKQIADDAFEVCDVVYEGCPDDECFGVKSLWTDIDDATFDIYEFNSSDINAGSFNITFGPSNMGDAGVTLEGTYYIDVLEEEI